MGLSLSVLIGLVLILPGVAFFFGYSRLHRSNKPATVLDQHVSVGLATVVLTTLLLHATGCAVANLLATKCGWPRPDIAGALGMLGGVIDKDPGLSAVARIDRYFLWIALYVGSLTAAGLALGKLANKRHRRVRDASWYDLLHPGGGVAFMWLVADLQLGSNCFLYAGRVKEFSTSKDGTLERVVLLNSVRKPIPYSPPSLGGPEDIDEGWVEIPGEFCVLQLKSCNTVNIDYFYADEEAEVAPTFAMRLRKKLSDLFGQGIRLGSLTGRFRRAFSVSQ